MSFNCTLLFLDSKLEANSTLELEMKDRTLPHNEFIPSGEVNISVPPFCIKTILSIPKINPFEDWSFDFDTIKYIISIKQMESNFGYHLTAMTCYGGAYSNYKQLNNGDEKYGAVGNTNGKFVI